MPIAITCGCGQKFVFEDRYAQQQARCTQCGNVFSIPKQPEQLNLFFYYRWSKQLPSTKHFKSILSILQHELLCYWGYAIVCQAEAIDLAHFAGFEAWYTRWKDTWQELNRPKTAAQAKK